MSEDSISFYSESGCDKLAHVLLRLSGKWTVLILMNLSQKPLRFGELKKCLPGVSQRMLTLSLRNLERDGFVYRKVLSEIPPAVCYQLTDLASSLIYPLQVIGEWSCRNAEKIVEAHLIFDNENERK